MKYLSFINRHSRIIGTLTLLTPLIGGGIIYAVVSMPGSDPAWLGPNMGVSRDVVVGFDANWMDMSCSSSAPPAPTSGGGYSGGGGGGGGSAGGSAS